MLVRILESQVQSVWGHSNEVQSERVEIGVFEVPSIADAISLAVKLYVQAGENAYADRLGRLIVPITTNDGYWSSRAYTFLEV